MKVQLDDICQRIYAGGDVPKDRFSSVMTNSFTVPIFANAEKDNGLYGYTDIAREYDPCVTVAARGTIGFAAIRDEPFLPVVRLITVVPDRSIVTLKFLYYALKSYKPKSSGTSIPQLTVPELKKHSITLYSIEKQNRITRILDSVSQIIVDRHKELDALDDLIKARFVEMFGDETYIRMPLDSLSQGKGEYGAQSASEAYDPNRPRYVRITDINDDGTLNNDFVSSSNHEDDKQYKLYYGDFLFARMGATVGKTYAYKNGNQIYAGYLIRYKLNLEKILPEYLFAYTKTDEYVNWVHLNQSGAAQPGINAKKYGSLEIPVAPIDEQKAFVRFVTQVGKSKTAIQKSLDEAQLLFDSLRQEYFG